MKKIVLFGLLLIGLLFSCSDIEEEFLESPAQSTLDESIIFSTPGLAKGSIDGIIEPMGQTNSYRGRYIPLYGFNTDVELLFDTDDDGDPDANLAIYDPKPNNSRMNSTNNVWAQMYTGIQRANIAIQGLREFGNPEPGTVLGQYLGEALTLRSLYYADLLKTWGDVQARFEPINSETVFLPKTEREVIYKQILQDLEEASTLVAWPNETAETSSVERINKAFVKGLRAKVALAASGFQQYPDGGGEGVIRRTNDPELSVERMYALAFEEAKEIIDSGQASLEPSFETFWRNFNEEVTTAGGESLWEIPFAEGRGRVLRSFGVRHRSPDQHTAQNRGGTAGPTPFVFYDYDEKDTRRDVTCVPYQYETDIDEDGFAAQELTNIDSWYFGKYRYEWMSATRRVTSSNDDGLNKIYMRFAEVLLIAAETANELQGPAAAAPYLKEIRRRAFPTEFHAEKVDAYVDALTTKEDMLNAIVDEHKFEFTGEMERKQALIRWNLLGEKLAEAQQKMTDLQNRTGEYEDVPTSLYWKLGPDNETLEIFGLNRGEVDNPGPEYSEKEWITIEDRFISKLFIRDPDTRQLWPIWQTFIDNSNGLLVNDYGY